MVVQIKPSFIQPSSLPATLSKSKYLTDTHHKPCPEWPQEASGHWQFRDLKPSPSPHRPLCLEVSGEWILQNFDLSSLKFISFCYFQYLSSLPQQNNLKSTPLIQCPYPCSLFSTLSSYVARRKEWSVPIHLLHITHDVTSLCQMLLQFSRLKSITLFSFLHKKERHFILLATLTALFYAFYS